MGLLALAIAPGLAICIFIYFKDKYKKEPLWLLILSFVLGMLSIIPAIIVETQLGLPTEKLASASWIAVALYAYLVVAGSEEASKFLVVRFFCFPRKAFDDPFDGIVYAVMVGMGFATLENIGYVLDKGLANGITRMLLSVPAHGTFAVLMGYHVSLAKFEPKKRYLHFFSALFWSILFHGTYDFFLFVGDTILHFAGAVASFGIAIYLSRKAIRKKLAYSKEFALNLEEALKKSDNGVESTV